jgi:hypothetical protein
VEQLPRVQHLHVLQSAASWISPNALIVVQYGTHQPLSDDPYHVQPATIDVYALDGEKLAEDLDLAEPVLGGGTELLILSAQPPDPWTITVYRWKGR